MVGETAAGKMAPYIWEWSKQDTTGHIIFVIVLVIGAFALWKLYCAWKKK
jgi:hypothetical protein